jgi:hypothetical protein
VRIRLTTATTRAEFFVVLDDGGANGLSLRIIRFGGAPD